MLNLPHYLKQKFKKKTPIDTKKPNKSCWPGEAYFPEKQSYDIS